MAQFKLFNDKAKEVGKITLKDEVFSAEYNPHLIHEVVVAKEAAARQGTKSTLTRTEVRGGGKKPHKQKKTGAARQGSTVSVHHIGGGVAFAPKPRDFSKKINVNARRSAMRSALSKKAADGEIVFIDKIVNDGKTKTAQALLDIFKFSKSTVVVLDGAETDAVARRAFKNIPYVVTTHARLLNVLDLVNNKTVLMTEASAKYIEEALSK